MRVFENEDDQRIHEWSQRFENMIEWLKPTIIHYFSKHRDYYDSYRVRDYESNTFVLKKKIEIHFLSEWVSPSNAEPYRDGTVIKMGYKTYSIFNKFAKSFLMDFGDKLVTFIDRDDLKLSVHVTISKNYSILDIESKTEEFMFVK